jgi:riboflavin kinase/FMN adenylyltransferase
VEILRLDSLGSRGWPAPAVTVGNFDGVHRGHQALLAETVRQARAVGGHAVVLTFDPHPARVLSPERAPAALTTLDQKAEELARAGADVLALLPFTEALSRESPAEFARLVLAGAVRARQVIVGEGFRFGRGRSGDVGELRRLGQDLGFEVHAVPPVDEDGAAVSSSRIREHLGRGEVAAARRLLGRSYSVDGRVVKGDGRGRTLGIPTANLESANEILPARGVYACRVRLAAGEPFHAAVGNRGTRPTFGGRGETLEVHLLDFDQDLYGSSLRVAIEERLRDERGFAGPAELLAQIREDITRARVLIGAAPGVPESDGV